MMTCRLGLLSLLLMLSACQALLPPASSASICALADRGIGGTGVTPEWSKPLADRGIGGTGVVGTVTGFGSLCVNGLEIGLDAGLPVDLPLGEGRAEDVQLGQVVEVVATGTGLALRAQTVRVLAEVSGPITDVKEAMLTVLGQLVELSPETLGGDDRPWRAGDWVTVSGLRDANGVVVASRLDRRAPGGKVLLAGPVTTGPDSRQRIGGVQLAGANALPADGRRVTVRGWLREGEFLVATAEVAPDRPFRGQIGRLFVEGFQKWSGGQVLSAPGTAGALAVSGLAAGEAVRAITGVGLDAQDSVGDMQVIGRPRTPTWRGSGGRGNRGRDGYGVGPVGQHGGGNGRGGNGGGGHGGGGGGHGGGR